MPYNYWTSSITNALDDASNSAATYSGLKLQILLLVTIVLINFVLLIYKKYKYANIITIIISALANAWLILVISIIGIFKPRKDLIKLNLILAFIGIILNVSYIITHPELRSSAQLLDTMQNIFNAPS